MKLKYPTEAFIKGRQYKIEYVNTSREVDNDLEGDTWLGTCGPSTIRVLATQPGFDVLDTLIHELLHAIIQRNKMLKVALKDGLEESFVDTLATEITSVLFDNKWIKMPKQGPPITKRIL